MALSQRLSPIKPIGHDLDLTSVPISSIGAWQLHHPSDVRSTVDVTEHGSGELDLARLRELARIDDGGVRQRQLAKLLDGLIAELERFRHVQHEVSKEGVQVGQQVEALSPLRALADQHSEAQTARRDVETQQRHLDTWLASRDIGINESRMAELGQQRDALAAELQLAEKAKEAADQERDARQRAVDGSGGVQLSALELGATLRDGIAERRAARERFAGWAGELDLELPNSAADLAGFVAEVQRVGADVERRHAELRLASFDAQDAKRRAGERKQATEKELEALRKHRSNLDSRLLRVRELLAERLQVPENRLPFVGELIQVRADEATWTGAIERVLGSFARTLVVPERHYLAAAEIIDATFLGARLVYEKVGQDGPVDPPAPGERSLPAKLELAEGPYQGWVAQRLAHRFNYLCVDHPREFADAERAVTRNGQIKHSASLHEKDDRRQITDRSRWVLGFTTEVKEAELERLIAEAGGEIEAARQTLGRLDEEERQVGALREAYARLRDFEWAQVDSESLAAQVEANERELGELRRKHADLARLEADLDRAKQAVAQAEQRRRQFAAQHDQVAARLEELWDQTDALRRQVEQAEPVPDEAAANLNAQAEELGSDRLDQRLRDALGMAARVATEALGRAEAAIRRAMGVYKRGWPGRAADWAETVDYLPEYLVRLEDLTKDRLPEFEHRFFDLLQRQARNNISQLSMQVKGARREIRSRVDDVNKSLLLTEFSRGGYLQIEVKDRSLPQVEEFLTTLGEITSGSMADVAGADSAEDRAAAEQRFLLMKRLLDRLGSSDPADRAWRDKCLDTRQHVSFQARVQDADGKQLDVFTGSGGRSGGERQKLVTFCLAAALRFQLSPAGARQPTYALVVIDEAFDKADHTFTQAGLEVFKTFGFQLLLATPLKMLQTIDDYVGGVVMAHKDAKDRSVIEELPFDGEVPAQEPADPLQEALV